jgi:predicted porin
MFKKTMIAGVLLASLAGTGQAQAQSNVTVYGTLDAGVINASHSGSANQSVTGVGTGIIGASHIGFTSREDLGGGRAAGVRIESQINTDDGSQGKSSSTGAVNPVFGREANVFLTDQKFGTVRLGRQENAAWRAYASNDSTGHSNIGGNPIFLSDGSSFGGTATSKVGLSRYTGGAFVSNALRYDSPAFAGFSATASRTFGGVPGDLDAGSANQIMLRYDNKGRVFGALGNYRAYDTNGNAWGANNYIGAGFRATADLTFSGAYWQLENPNGNGAANTKFDLYNVGVRYNVTPRLTASVGYYQLQDKINSNNGTDLQSLVLRYSMSKRTIFYTALSNVNNKGTSGFAAWGGGGANANSMAISNGLSGAGADQTAFAVGMRHTF